jgi:CRP/FNR family transcriptional regulator, cyclic AMP receptor protein
MTQFVNILKQADIFYNLTPTQLEMVANLCQEKIYNAEEMIFPESANSDELYVIIQGEVNIQVNPGLVSEEPAERPVVTIATLRRGQSFGEIALVDRGLRSASARATQNNTRLLVLPRDRLILLCETYPLLGYRLMYNLAADLALKMRSANLRAREELLYGRPTGQPYKHNTN